MILDGHPGRVIGSHDLIGRLPAAVGQPFSHLRQRQITQRRRRTFMAHLPHAHFSETPMNFCMIRSRSCGTSSFAVNSRTSPDLTSGWALMVTSTRSDVFDR